MALGIGLGKPSWESEAGAPGPRASCGVLSSARSRAPALQRQVTDSRVSWAMGSTTRKNSNIQPSAELRGAKWWGLLICWTACRVVTGKF